MASHDNVALARIDNDLDENLFDTLHNISWDFASKCRASPIEKLHPYPAKFIPDIPAALLDNLPLPRDSLILDPFCGSGTTLAEAQMRGFDAIGVDLNPIACLISRARTAPLAANAVDAAAEVVERAKRMGFAPIPEIPNLDHWFARPAQDAVARLVAAIGRAPAKAKDFLDLAFPAFSFGCPIKRATRAMPRSRRISQSRSSISRSAQLRRALPRLWRDARSAAKSV